MARLTSFIDARLSPPVLTHKVFPNESNFAIKLVRNPARCAVSVSKEISPLVKTPQTKTFPKESVFIPIGNHIQCSVELPGQLAFLVQRTLPAGSYFTIKI